MDVGTCFGFQIRSNLLFHYLRGGDGVPLHVGAPSQSGVAADAQLLREWTPRPGRNLHARLYHDGRSYHLWFEGDTWFTVEPDVPRIVVPETADVVGREEMLWGLPAGLCMLHRGYLPLHAAAVEVEGAAILLAAPGGFGKTTLAAAFYHAGFRVLSEDITCISMQPQLSVIPGPAMLRVRPDVIGHLELPSAESVRITDSRISFALDKASRGNCDPVPIRGVLFLRASSEWKTDSVRPTDAVPDLWTLSQRIPTDSGLVQCFRNVVDLANGVPIRDVYRPLEFGELRRTVDSIVELIEP